MKGSAEGRRQQEGRTGDRVRHGRQTGMDCGVHPGRAQASTSPVVSSPTTAQAAGRAPPSPPSLSSRSPVRAGAGSHAGVRRASYGRRPCGGASTAGRRAAGGRSSRRRCAGCRRPRGSAPGSCTRRAGRGSGRATASRSRPSGPGTSQATGTSPRVSWAAPATPASGDPGALRSTASTSSGWMFSPPRMIRSFSRPQTVK